MDNINKWMVKNSVEKFVQGNIHGMWENLINAYDFLGLVCPRDHGKTFYWTKMFPLYWVEQGYGDVLVFQKYRNKFTLVEDKGKIVYAPYNSGIKGERPSLIICDDVSNDSSLYSEVARCKDNDYFDHFVDNLIQEGAGKVVVVGSMDIEGGIFDHIRGKRKYNVFKIPALINNKPIWNTRHSKKMLTVRKSEVGKINFGREFMCERIPVCN